jgi:hypothetical protein
VRGEIAWRTGIGATIFRVFAMPQKMKLTIDEEKTKLTIPTKATNRLGDEESCRPIH